MRPSDATPAIVRIERRLLPEKRGYITPCRIFQGQLRSGYGRVQVGSRTDGTYRTAQAHRIVYEHYVGPIPKGWHVDHLCRQHDCCEHTHLEAVTPGENTRRGFAAAVARWRPYWQTHCKHDHEFTPENTYTTSRGHRACRACRKQRAALHYRTVRRAAA